MSTPEPKPLVDKLDAAHRQLDTALWLWFNECDLVSVNTLAGAAHGIFDDLLQHEKKGRAIPFDRTPDGMKPRKWRKIVKEAQSFAKHARTDPDDVQIYTPVLTAVYLFYVVSSCAQLSGKEGLHGLRALFMIHFAVMHPDSFDPAFLPKLQKGIDVEIAKNLSRSEFLERASAEYPQAGFDVFPPHLGRASGT